MKLYLVIAALCIALAGTAYTAFQGHRQVQEYRSTISALETSLRASQEATVQAMRSAVAVQGASQSNRVQTQGVLNEVPDWSNAPVPDAVRDSLCDTVRCSTRD